MRMKLSFCLQLVDMLYHRYGDCGHLHEFFFQPGEVAARVEMLVARSLGDLANFLSQNRGPFGP